MPRRGDPLDHVLAGLGLRPADLQRARRKVEMATTFVRVAKDFGALRRRNVQRELLMRELRPGVFVHDERPRAKEGLSGFVDALDELVTEVRGRGNRSR